MLSVQEARKRTKERLVLALEASVYVRPRLFHGLLKVELDQLASRWSAGQGTMNEAISELAKTDVIALGPAGIALRNGSMPLCAAFMFGGFEPEVRDFDALEIVVQLVHDLVQREGLDARTTFDELVEAAMLNKCSPLRAKQSVVLLLLNGFLLEDNSKLKMNPGMTGFASPRKQVADSGEVTARPELLPAIEEVRAVIGEAESESQRLSEEASVPAAAEHPCARGRRVLSVFWDKYIATHRIVKLPVHAQEFSPLNLSRDEVHLTLNDLRRRGLLDSWPGGGPEFSLTDKAVDVFTHDKLDDVLPVPGRKPPAESKRLSSAAVALDAFAFMKDPAYKAIVERDVTELDAAIASGCCKTTMLLCGSLAEAALLDVATRNRAIAASYSKQAFPDKFSLADLVDVASGEHLILPQTKSASAVLVGSRDLIHPQAEVRECLRIDASSARAAVAFLEFLLGDLKGASVDGKILAFEQKS